MTTAPAPVTVAGADVRPARSATLSPVRDALAIAGRNLTALRRVPRLLIFSTVPPVVFVLLFRYVFGGVVSTSLSVPYVDYLIPGVFVQTSVFGAIGAAIGLATDLQTGCWSGSGPCPWPARRCWPAGPLPTSLATSSWWR